MYWYIVVKNLLLPDNPAKGKIDSGQCLFSGFRNCVFPETVGFARHNKERTVIQRYFELWNIFPKFMP